MPFKPDGRVKVYCVARGAMPVASSGQPTAYATYCGRYRNRKCMVEKPADAGGKCCIECKLAWEREEFWKRNP